MSGLPSEAELRAAAGDDPGARQVAGLFAQARADAERITGMWQWAEAEIRAAQARHPAAADLLWHAFPVLAPAPGFAFPAAGFIWRGHFAELLDRVAAGADTRPATWAEIVLLCSAASKTAPLNHAASGLMLRAWLAAFPANPVWDGHAAEVEHGYASGGYAIGELERQARQAVARRNPGRRLVPRAVTCDGVHGGVAVPCRFTTRPGPEQAAAVEPPPPGGRPARPPKGKRAAYTRRQHDEAAEREEFAAEVKAALFPEPTPAPGEHR